MSDEIEKGENLIARFAEEYGYVPVFGDPNLANAFNDEELIDYFAYGIGKWIAKPLGTLHKMALEDPDYGFAIMFVVNSFPEFLGKIMGYSEGRRYFPGIRYILGPEVSDELARWLYNRMRSSIAHSLFVQEGIVIYAMGSVPLRYNRDKTAVVITPVAFAQACLIAISRYIRALQAELNIGESASTNYLGAFKKYMISEKQKYLHVELSNTSYGCRVRVEQDADLIGELKAIQGLKVCESTTNRPDVIVDSPHQLLKLVVQLIS